jgi:hypothetical protein
VEIAVAVGVDRLDVDDPAADAAAARDAGGAVRGPDVPAARRGGGGNGGRDRGGHGPLRAGDGGVGGAQRPGDPRGGEDRDDPGEEREAHGGEASRDGCAFGDLFEGGAAVAAATANDPGAGRPPG